MKFSWYIFLSLTGLFFSLQAQGVKIGGNPGSVQPSAILELESTQGGLLLPRMTVLQRNAITSPQPGLVIYNTTSNCAEMYTPGGWVSLACECTAPPAASASIQTPTTGVCIGATGLIFTTPQIAGANTYTWTVPAGMAITSGQGTASITVSINGAVSGNISVTSGNACGNASAYTEAISVQTPDAGFTTSPSTPTTNSAAALVPNTTAGSHSWTMTSGSPATSSATSPSVTWTVASTYAVSHTLVTAQGCSATVTNSISVTNCVTGGSHTASFTGSVVQWTVPANVCAITIDARGAQGGKNNPCTQAGGLGARQVGTFTVTPGTVLNLIVGGQGQNWGTDNANNGGGGGGGSFVYEQGSNQLLIAAGGGGGGAICSSGGNPTNAPGVNGTTANSGTFDRGNINAGGTNGSNGVGPGGGKGWNSVLSSPAGTCSGVCGGFGGGGYPSGTHSGGGGGGYSGGGSVPYGTGPSAMGGGGGGSFNSGTNPTNSSGFQTGNGQIILTW